MVGTLNLPGSLSVSWASHGKAEGGSPSVRDVLYAAGGFPCSSRLGLVLGKVFDKQFRQGLERLLGIGARGLEREFRAFHRGQRQHRENALPIDALAVFDYLNFRLESHGRLNEH